MNESIDDLTSINFHPKNFDQLATHHNNCNNCKQCNIHNGTPKKILFKGSVPCDILIIGEGPNNEDAAQEIPFSEMGGLELQKQLRDAREIVGNDPAIGYTNALKCIPQTNGKYRKPKASEISNCSPHLLEFLLICKPRVIITAGRTAEHALLRDNVYGSNYENSPDIPIIHIPHPLAIIHQHEKGVIDRKRAVIGLVDAFRHIKKLDAKKKKKRK
jgi:uracil-DNA glycosylase family 4